MQITINQARALLLDHHPTRDEKLSFDAAVHIMNLGAVSWRKFSRRVITLLTGAGVDLPENVEVVP